jgi:hypothetical protein
MKHRRGIGKQKARFWPGFEVKRMGVRVTMSFLLSVSAPPAFGGFLLE